MVNLATGGKGIKIPQIVAHLEPLLKDNKISLLGKIVLQNPTESELKLDTIILSIMDEKNNVLEKSVLEWEKSTVASRNLLEAPVKIDLDLATLNNKYISVVLQTAFTYKTLDLRVPIESKVAVIDLNFLKDSITRPFDVDVYTKLRSDILGRASIDYVFNIANPVSIDLLFEDGQILIYTEKKDIAKTIISPVIFKTGEASLIQGSIDLGNFFKEFIMDKLVRMYPLRFRMTGKLRVPNTDIAMPFKIESIQEIDFSLLKAPR